MTKWQRVLQTLRDHPKPTAVGIGVLVGIFVGLMVAAWWH